MGANSGPVSIKNFEVSPHTDISETARISEASPRDSAHALFY